MSIILITNIISTLTRVFTLVLLVYAVLTWVMKPWHPVMEFMRKIIEPMLTPIRRIVPTFGGMDFSPLILLILVQLLSTLVINLLFYLAR